MIKSTLLKSLKPVKFLFLKNTNFQKSFTIINNNNYIYNNIYFKQIKFFSTQEANENELNSQKIEKPLKEKNKKEPIPSNQTDLITTQKKKKKKPIKAKVEQVKKEESFQNPESNENITNEQKDKVEDKKIKNDKIVKPPKKDDRETQKQKFRAKIKEIANLKDMYQIKSTKMGAPNPKSFIDFSKIKNSNVTVKLYDQETFQMEAKIKDNLIPVSPKLGPFIIENPKVEDKTYHWCSCGLSKKQPFCDSSHSGTGFRPINFKLAEKCDSMMLCGCKLSKVAPFCDGVTCIDLKKLEEDSLESIGMKKTKAINITTANEVEKQRI